MTQQDPASVRAQTRPTEFKDKQEETVNGHHWVDAEDSGWEDEEGEEDDDEVMRVYSLRTVSPGGSIYSKTSRRRKRSAFPTIKGFRKQVPSQSYTTTTTTNQARASPKADEPPLIAREDVVDGLRHGLSFTFRYALDVVVRALLALRYPLSGVIFLFLLGYMLKFVAKSFFSPFCVLPGLSSLHLCRPEQTHPPPPIKPVAQWADYPRLMETESKTFEQLMDGFIGGSALSLEVKRAEMATADLAALVRISDLKAKASLSTSLLVFVDDAKRTGRSLQRMSSKVGGAVDNIMAANEHALKTIEATKANEPSPWSVAAIVPWLSNQMETKAVVAETFEDAMNTLSKQLERLIVEAEANNKNLNDLEEHLYVIHELVAQEDSSLTEAKYDLLAELWTKLGGNRKQLRNFDGHLALLKDLASYRKQAMAHVAAALQTLRAMEADMEDMRERVAAPDLLGSSVPIEVHMRSIEMGLERLKEGRIRSRRLEEEAVRRVLSMNGSEEDI